MVLSALGWVTTKGKAYLSPPDSMSLHSPTKGAIGNFLAPDQEAISNAFEHSLAFFRISALPSIKNNYMLKKTIGVFTGRFHTSDHWDSWRCLTPAWCRGERRLRACRHHLYEELMYVMPKLHMCCFVFIKPYCFLHKFHYPWNIFLCLLLWFFSSQEQKLHSRTQCSLLPE